MTHLQLYIGFIQLDSVCSGHYGFLCAQQPLLDSDSISKWKEMKVHRQIYIVFVENHIGGKERDGLTVQNNSRVTKTTREQKEKKKDVGQEMIIIPPCFSMHL